jgi:ABC-type nitrate/sulfonate/bicarbonate transport system substrate-binding protein
MRITRFLAGAVLALAATATSDDGRAQDKLTMVFSTPPQTYAIPYYFAQDTGIFKSLGLELAETNLTGDVNAIRLVIQGEGDIALTGPGTMLVSIHNGAAIKSIGAWQPTVDYVIIGKIQDLAGKTIASIAPGEMPTVMPKMVMTKYGVDQSKVEFDSVGAQNARLQAVLAGKADATMVGILPATMGVEQGTVNIISIVKNEFPDLGYVALAVRNSDLTDAKKRAAYKKFMRGSIEGARLVMKDPDKGSELLWERSKRQMDLALIKKVVRQLNDLNVWGVDGGTDPKVMEFTEKMNREIGVQTRTIAVKDALDGSIAEEVVKELGPYKGS